MLCRGDPPHVEVGVEARPPFAAEGRVEPSALRAGLVAKTVARGAPTREALAAAHADIQVELEGTRWEVYDHWRDNREPADYAIEVYGLVRGGDGG